MEATPTPIGIGLRRRRDEVLERLLAAQNANDVDAALACFAHPRYELIGNARVYDGPEEVRRYYRMTRHHFPDLHFEVIAVHHAAEVVVAELWMSGTHLGSSSDFEASGKRFRCRTAVIFTFAHDQLTGARVYYDTGTIARQLA
ncbi:MAG TPA: ester cyclase [Acidimicrobiales bacterium]